MKKLLAFALLSILAGYAAAAGLRITLRPAETTQPAEVTARLLPGDSARILTRLDWLYDEPGFRPARDRATVEIQDGRIVVSSSDTAGSARIEYLASTSGVVSFRKAAADSVAWAVLDSADNWLRRHPVAGLESLSGRVYYRGADYRVAEKDYPAVSKALSAIDPLVFGEWLPAFAPLDWRSTGTSRTLYLVGRQAEMSNTNGPLFTSAVPHRFRGVRSPNAPPVPVETWPYFVMTQLSSRTFDAEPVRRLAEFTAANVGRRLAVVLDGEVFGAPMIQSEIPDGSFQVATTDTIGFRARDLTTLLLSGPLFTPLVVERVERAGGK